MSKFTEALAFGMEAHKGQVRKYTNEPYFTGHCVPVAECVKANGGTEDMVIAALLHDTIEDTSILYEEVMVAFGEGVADLVLELTDVFTWEAFPMLNRATRKKMEAERLGKVSADAKEIKRCDIEHNTGSSIMEYDPGFAKVYLAEKEYLMKCMFDKP